MTVYQSKNKTSTSQTSQGSSAGSYAVLDVDDKDQLFVGGVMNDTKV